MNQGNKEKDLFIFLPYPTWTPGEVQWSHSAIWLAQACMCVLGGGVPAMHWGLNSGPYTHQSYSATELYS